MIIKLRKNFKQSLSRYGKCLPLVAMLLAGLSVAVTGCSNVDCTLGNTVYTTYDFCDAETGSQFALKDTLTVRTFPSDSIIYNKGYNVRTLHLPMSFAKDVDTLLFEFSAERGRVVDTVFIRHTNDPFFESVDCGTTMFHTITAVRCGKGNSIRGVSRIDSVALVNSKVNYDKKSHIKLYFSRS